MGYINGDYPQPPETDPSFRKWRIKNAMVKGWLINSIENTQRLSKYGILLPRHTLMELISHGYTSSDVVYLK